MLDTQIGFIINETAASKEANFNVVKKQNNRLIIETCLIDTDTLNRNGRFYPSAEFDPELVSERTIELLNSGNLKGENGHPMSKDLVRQQTVDPNNTVVVYLKLWKDGNNVMAYATGDQNQLGLDFDNCIKAGQKPSFSLRALGTLHNTRRGAEVRGMKIITWDRVIYPSHKVAYMTKIVSEGAIIDPSKEGYNPNENRLYLEENDKGMIAPILNAQVVDYIKEKSCNLKTIRESFDCFYDDISLMEGGKAVKLLDKTGNIIIVNTEKYIRNKIMDYCSDMY